MNEKTLRKLINTGAIFSWAIIAWALMFKTNLWKVSIFFAFSIIIGSLIFWFNHRPLQRKKLISINNLSKNLEDIKLGAIKPLSIGETPEEVHSFIDALNHLLNEKEDRFKSDHNFNLHASHELRTPLAGIRLLTQIAQRAKSTSQREDALNNIIKTVDKSTRLIDQLLTLSRLRSVHIISSKESVEPSDLCDKIIAEYKLPLKNKSITLTRKVQDSLPPIQAHKEFLEMLLRNLLDNAVEFTPEDGAICISAYNDKDSALAISIEDSGPGVAEDFFDAFIVPVQDLYGKHSHGLTIVKHIAELHCCDILYGRSDLGGLSIKLTFPKPSNG